MIRTGVVTIIPSPPKRPSASARLFGALADLDRLCIEQYAPTDELAVVVGNLRRAIADKWGLDDA